MSSNKTFTGNRSHLAHTQIDMHIAYRYKYSRDSAGLHSSERKQEEEKGFDEIFIKVEIDSKKLRNNKRRPYSDNSKYKTHINVHRFLRYSYLKVKISRAVAKHQENEGVKPILRNIKRIVFFIENINIEKYMFYPPSKNNKFNFVLLYF